MNSPLQRFRGMAGAPFGWSRRGSGRSDTTSRRDGRCSRKFRGGFSLTELIVVIAILMVLAVGIAIPAVASGRSRVMRVTCASHLRQWGVATALYVDDNAGRLPPDGAPNGTWTRNAWYVNLPRVVGIPAHFEWYSNVVARGRWDDSIWICPAEARRVTVSQRPFFYCLNRNVNGVGAASRGIGFGEIQNPAKVPWLYDNGRRAAVAGENNVHTNAHERAANFLMLDGAVKRLGAERYWDFARRRGRRDPEDLEWRP